jgi:hypothetical protein
MERNDDMSELKLNEKQRDNEIAMILNTPFEEMGMKNATVFRFKRYGISNVGELLDFLEKHRRMSEAGWPCDGKWLGSTMINELLKLLKERDWDWILQYDKEERGQL